MKAKILRLKISRHSTPQKKLAIDCNSFLCSEYVSGECEAYWTCHSTRLFIPKERKVRIRECERASVAWCACLLKQFPKLRRFPEQLMNKLVFVLGLQVHPPSLSFSGEISIPRAPGAALLQQRITTCTIEQLLMEMWCGSGAGRRANKSREQKQQ